MVMDFRKAAKISNYIAKDYAEKIFRLIMAYQDISASEAASRLGIHIRTVQDFLDVMAEYGIIEKKEVFERKRPYYRYAIKEKKIKIVIDLDDEFSSEKNNVSDFRIKESKDTGAKYSIARNGEYFSAVTIWIGEGRTAKERKISLTVAQGQFLYYLPFPDAEPLSIDEIMEKGNIDNTNRSEVLDIVNELFDLKVVEKIN
jgi:predicted transcriptional regulator